MRKFLLGKGKKRAGSPLYIIGGKEKGREGDAVSC